ncbi:DUF2442 domain-containing protein [Candidatus Poribacteria bacterium]|nr:DUF2442 domain-containing protein [Candidatus Poribacteria bacterium]
MDELHSTPRLIEVRPLPQYCLHLVYADGVEGVVDLSELVGRGVFKSWVDPEAFRKVRIGKRGQLVWGRHIDICAEAMCQRVSGHPALARLGN